MKILFFGVSRELAGCGEDEVILDGVVTADDIWAKLIERYPGLERCRGISRLAVDMEYYNDSATLPTDIREIAVIPPVAGG
jgi:molybdopterin converting factor small subunit